MTEEFNPSFDVIETGGDNEVTPLEAITRGEYDIQIATAKRFPRHIGQFRNEVREMACRDEATAAECTYSLPRGGKAITGPSARFAEIVASAWGNCRVGARVISEDSKFVTAQGVFFDMQRNALISYEVKRRITDRNGNKFNDDMISTTANAACAIALRNAVLKGVPKAFWAGVWEESRDVVRGDARTLGDRVTAMIQHFSTMGVAIDRLLAAAGRDKPDDLTLDDLADLKATAAGIQSGEINVDDAFPVTKDDGMPPAGKHGGAKKAAVPEEPKPKAEPASPPKSKPELVAQLRAAIGAKLGSIGMDSTDDTEEPMLMYAMGIQDPEDIRDAVARAEPDDIEAWTARVKFSKNATIEALFNEGEV